MYLVKEILADSPLAYLPLWEDRGTVAKDLSGNGHDGTYTEDSGAPAPLLGQAGLTAEDSPGVSLTQFSSVAGAFVNIDTLGSLGSNILSSSVELLVKTTSTLAVRAFFGTVNTGSNMIFGMYANTDQGEASSTGKTALHIRDSANVAKLGAISTNIYDGNWHHVVWVVNSDLTYSCWVDNTSVAVTMGSGTPSSVVNFGFPMRLGVRNVRGSNDRCCVCSLAHVAFYTTRLTGSRVAAHYNAIAMRDPRSASLRQAANRAAVFFDGKWKRSLWTPLGERELAIT